jgi:hypothetical protein
VCFDLVLVAHSQKTKYFMRRFESFERKWIADVRRQLAEHSRYYISGGNRMKHRHLKHFIYPAIFLVIMLALVSVGWLNATSAQKKTAPTTASDWPAYGRDAGGSRFVPHKQINRANVKNLKLAWTYRTS